MSDISKGGKYDKQNNKYKERIQVQKNELLIKNLFH